MNCCNDYEPNIVTNFATLHATGAFKNIKYSFPLCASVVVPCRSSGCFHGGILPRNARVYFFRGDYLFGINQRAAVEHERVVAFT